MTNKDKLYAALAILYAVLAGLLYFYVMGKAH
jgi:hypothetical protein